MSFKPYRGGKWEERSKMRVSSYQLRDRSTGQVAAAKEKD